ncbi:MAG: trypsin-like peptidase domain-containing protein [Thermoanaerobaculia bacterium]|nr:trypsin-like peptidase domain-containing protein [Thermoanaerobaculia bacterium]
MRPVSRILFPLLLLIALLAGAVGFLGGALWRQTASPAPDPSPAEPLVSTADRPELTDQERATIALFRRASPSVVFITSVTRRRDFFSMRPQEIPRGSGSGFVWDGTGHVVTNFHVLSGSSGVRVTLNDRSTWEAELVGAEPEKDLAVLRIRAPAALLRPLALGRSSDLLVGQQVYAIGNPFGLDQTLTTGVISALGREIMSLAGIPIRDVVQTDAAINPGNSGGPLLDSAGRLIGVNTQIITPSGASAGIGFAIPVDTVKWVVPELIEHGRVIRPTLGVRLLPNQVANLELEGALVLDVVPGSGAARAGIVGTRRDRRGAVVLGDVIVDVGGREVRTPEDLVLALERREPGDLVEVTLLREGRRRVVQVELGPPSS